MAKKPSKLLTKQGRYGSSKAKCFTVMLDGGWYPSKQLCLATGIGYYSLARAFSRWVGFEYIERRPILFGGRYEYRLLPKAKSWLRLVRLYLPNYKLFMAELAVWQRNMDAMLVDELLNIPFLEFTAALDELIKEFQKNNAKRY